MALMTHSVEAFSIAVAAIYGAALDPDHWLAALQRIGELIDSPCVCLSVTDYAQQEVALCVNHGYEPQYLKVYFERFAINPLFSLGHLRPVGEVYTLAMLLESKELVESRFYKEWSKPQGLGDFMGLNAVRSARRAGGVSGNRMLAQPRYGEDDVRLLRLLAPHICRTFAISDALDLKSVATDALEATLDALASGVYLTDREARVVYMNRAAERQIKTGNALRIVANRLSPVDYTSRTVLSQAIGAAIGDEGAAPGKPTRASCGIWARCATSGACWRLSAISTGAAMAWPKRRQEGAWISEARAHGYWRGEVALLLQTCKVPGCTLTAQPSGLGSYLLQQPVVRYRLN